VEDEGVEVGGGDEGSEDDGADGGEEEEDGDEEETVGVKFEDEGDEDEGDEDEGDEDEGDEEALLDEKNPFLIVCFQQIDRLHQSDHLRSEFILYSLVFSNNAVVHYLSISFFK